MALPVLNIHRPPDSYPHNAFVAFPAMVQDTSPGKQFYADDGTAQLKECTVLWAVSVPGHTQLENTAHYSPARPHKFPLPGVPHVGVQVKIYDSCLAENIQPSDLCTFVGHLTLEPLHTADLETSQIVPTLHVHHISDNRPATNLALTPHPRLVCDSLVRWIADQALGGDQDAAQWLLLSVIARTQSRTPPIYPPSLTLSAFPSAPILTAIPTLHHIFSLLLPLFVTLPLSLDALNTTSFYPESKDDDLHSGSLQLPKGTVCLLTETAITEGSLLEKGVQNLRVIQNAMNTQTLDYVFPFHRFPFPTDINFVVLTEGKKSAFFDTSVNIPLRVTNGENSDCYKSPRAIEMPGQEVLDQWRSFIAASSTAKVTISDETAQYIQDDFVKERRAPTATSAVDKKEAILTPDDLVHRVVTARLLALSYHEPFVTKEIWEEAKALDVRRNARL